MMPRNEEDEARSAELLVARFAATGNGVTRRQIAGLSINVLSVSEKLLNFFIFSNSDVDDFCPLLCLPVHCACLLWENSSNHPAIPKMR